MTAVKVVKNATEPESKEILAEAIIRISTAMEQLTKSGMNERAIIVLVHAETKIPMRDIREVIVTLKKLRGLYCR